MHLFNKLISHFIGNFVMWIYYGGTKSINEVAKEDNSLIGFIFTIVFLLLLYFFNY